MSGVGGAFSSHYGASWEKGGHGRGDVGVGTPHQFPVIFITSSRAPQCPETPPPPPRSRPMSTPLTPRFDQAHLGHAPDDLAMPPYYSIYSEFYIYIYIIDKRTQCKTLCFRSPSFRFPRGLAVIGVTLVTPCPPPPPPSSNYIAFLPLGGGVFAGRSGRKNRRAPV